MTRKRTSIFTPSGRGVVDEELKEHLEMLQRRFESEGMSPADARAAAHARFGDVNTVRDECHELSDRIDTRKSRTEFLAELRQDIRHAFRALRRSPLYTSVAMLTLAVGIGSTIAIFSVANAALFRPLGYAHANRLVTVWNATGPGRADRTAIAAPEFTDILAGSRSLDAVAAMRASPVTFAAPCSNGDCAPEQLNALVVSPNLFDVLGATPQLGRSFSSDEGGLDVATVVILSDALWRRIGADRSIVGRSVMVNGAPRTVVGVMGPEVRFPDAPLGYIANAGDVFLPRSHHLRQDERGNQNLAVVGRLAPGQTLESARRDIALIAARFRSEFPDRYVVQAPQWRLTVDSLADDMLGDARPMLFAVLAAAALVLIIGSANVVNLTIARGAARLRELAVRAALGATRGRLVRQGMTETVVLALLGGTLGVGIAFLAIAFIRRLDPGVVPRIDQVSMDTTVLLFALALSLLVGAACGLIPALQLSRTDLRPALAGDGAPGAGGRGERLRKSLVVAQLAIAVMILIGAGLLGRSFAALTRVPTGFDGKAIETFRLGMPAFKYDSAHKRVLGLTRVVGALAASPGVQGASAVYPLPMSGDGWSGTIHVEGRVENGTPPHAEYASVLPGYFGIMGIDVQTGRDFDRRDDLAAERVVIIDASLAERHWPNESPIGKRISTVSATGPWLTVVGIVGHVRRGGARDQGESQIYLSALQRPQPSMHLVARVAPLTNFAEGARAAVRGVDRDLVMAAPRSMRVLESSALARDRFSLAIITVFGAAGLIVAAVGVAGVMAYLVAQRRRELAVRVALGAGRAGIVRLVSGEALRLGSIGVALGLLASVVASRALETGLFGVSSTDPITYIAIALLLVLVTIAAAAGPAIQASRTDPARVLRGG